MMEDFQSVIVDKIKQIHPELYSSGIINLDFHSIPHFGTESEMEKVWCGARGKTMKGANTVFAQDSMSNAIMYTRSDILRSEEAEEVKRFVEFWKKAKGPVTETLVFDCKFTKYAVLDELAQDSIRFITLRKRNAKLINETLNIKKDEWKKLYIPIPKRKHKHVSVYEETVVVGQCKTSFRQITIKDHGRANPTYVLLNDFSITIKEVLIIYAKRWHIESKLGELVSFFNLNALSSPLMVRIHFDIIWTFIADTIYHLMAKDLRRFESSNAPTIFKKFINMPGKIIYDGKDFQIKIRKRAHTPVLMGVKKLQGKFSVPWLDNKNIEIVWTA